MITKALLARFEARPEQDAAVREFLLGARPMVEQEPRTATWFALRFGRGDYGIFDAFADETARQVHLDGAIARALVAAKDTLLSGMPEISRVDLLAHKLPEGELQDVSKGLLLTFKAREGHEAAVTAFLRDARRFVDDESGTRAWFALQLDPQHFGIFDVFPDNGARFAHLTGHVPRELAKHALSLLGGMPEMHLLDIVSASNKGPGTA